MRNIDFEGVQFYLLDDEIISALKKADEQNINCDPSSVIVAFFENENNQKCYNDSIKYRSKAFLKAAKSKFPNLYSTIESDSIYRTVAHKQSGLYALFVHRAFFEATYPRAPEVRAIQELRLKISNNLDINLKGRKNKLKEKEFDSKLVTLLRKFVFNLPDFSVIATPANNNNLSTVPSEPESVIESSILTSAEMLQLGTLLSDVISDVSARKNTFEEEMIDLSEDTTDLQDVNFIREVSQTFDLITVAAESDNLTDNISDDNSSASSLNTEISSNNNFDSDDSDSSLEDVISVLAELSNKRPLPIENLPPLKKPKTDNIEKSNKMMAQIMDLADQNKNALIKAVQNSNYKIINIMMTVFLGSSINTDFVKLVKTSVDENNIKILGIAIATGDSITLNLVLKMCKLAGIKDPASQLKANYQLRSVFSTMPLEDIAQVLYTLCKIGFFKEQKIRENVAAILVARDDMQTMSREEMKEDLKIPSTQFFKPSPEEQQAKREYKGLCSTINKLLPKQNENVDIAPVLTK